IPAGQRSVKRRSRTSTGQSLVEFALVLPLFLLMLFGLIDVGRYVYLNSVMSQAAREGARVAAVEVGWIGSTDPACGKTGGPVCPANLAALQADVTAAANRMIAPFGVVNSVYVNCSQPSGAPSGKWTAPVPLTNCSSDAVGTDVVSVRVVLTSTPITPIVGQIVGSVTAAGSATMIIN
ncbi:MAG: TadE/TadG family type IV pilus assembly protein, partial [Candidatus Limnocylindrales bacterium]